MKLKIFFISIIVILLFGNYVQWKSSQPYSNYIHETYSNHNSSINANLNEINTLLEPIKLGLADDEMVSRIAHRYQMVSMEYQQLYNIYHNVFSKSDEQTNNFASAVMMDISTYFIREFHAEEFEELRPQHLEIIEVITSNFTSIALSYDPYEFIGEASHYFMNELKYFPGTFLFSQNLQFSKK